MSGTGKRTAPVTPAIRVLREAGVVFTDHLYDYVEKGGTAASSVALGVDEHTVIKTLVMEAGKDQPIIVLMHGDRQVSTKELARFLDVKRVAPCDPASVEKHTGYRVGGTSPFGTRTQLPVYMEESILKLEKIHINGGHRGYLVGLAPSEVVRVLKPTLVNVSTTTA